MEGKARVVPALEVVAGHLGWMGARGARARAMREGWEEVVREAGAKAAAREVAQVVAMVAALVVVRAVELVALREEACVDE